MKITTITVHAETRFNDPHENFRNHCPSITMTAEVGPEENPDTVASLLQMRARGLLECERTTILTIRKHEHELAGLTNSIEMYEDEIKRLQRSIENETKELAEERARPVPETWIIEEKEDTIRRCTRRIEEATKSLNEARAKLATLQP